MPSVADGWLTLRVRETEVARDVERAVKRADTGKAGEQAGQKFGTGFFRGFERTTSRKTGIGALAGEITSLGHASTIASREASYMAKGIAAINIATGIAEPALAGLIVAAGGLAAAYASAGAGLAAYGLAVRPVMTEVSNLMKLQDQAAAGSKTAQKQLNAMLQTTPPAVVRFAQSVRGARDAYTAWGNSLAVPVLAPLSKALTFVRPVLSAIRPLVIEAAAALHQLVNELGAKINAGGLTNIVNTLLPHIRSSILDAGHALGNVVAGIWGVIRAFLPMEATIGGGVVRLTARFKEWGRSLPSHSGFQSLMNMFRTQTPLANQVLRNLATIIKNVAAAVVGLASPANSRALLQLLVPLTAVMVQLSKHPALVRMVLYFVMLNSVLKKVQLQFTLVRQGLSGVLGLAGGVSRMVQGFRSAEVAASAFSGTSGTIGGKLRQLVNWFGKTAVGARLAAAAQWLLNTSFLGCPIVLIVAGIAAIGAAFYLLWNRSAGFRKFWIGLWNGILGAAKGVWNWIKRNWPLLASILGGPIGAAVVFITKHWRPIAGFFRGSWNTIKAVFRAAWNAIKGGLSAAWAAISRATRNVWNGIRSYFAGWWNAEKNTFRAAWNAIKAVSRAAWTAIRTGLTAAWAAISRVTRTVWNGIRAFFAAWWNSEKNTFRAAWNAIKAGLSAAWNAIRNTTRAVWNGIRSYFGGWWSGLRSSIGRSLSQIKGALSGAWNAIKGTAISTWTAIKNAIGRVWNGIKTVIQTPVNWVLSHIWNPFAGLVNKVLGFFGIKFRLPTHAQGGPVAPGPGDYRAAGFASGGLTDAAPGGAFVRHGRGPRIDDQLILASRGELVVPTSLVRAGAVDHLRGRIPGFQQGGVAPGRPPPPGAKWVLPNLKKLVQGLVGSAVAPIVHGMERAVSAAMPGSTWGNLIGKVITKPLDAFLDWVRGKDKVAAAGPGPGAGGGLGAGRWAPVVRVALGLLHQSLMWTNAVLQRINMESGGNPTIVNRWDSNWIAGTPSVGLMQVIGPTFAAYAGPFRRTGPFLYGVSTSPLANIYAGLNYAIHRYGSLSVMTRPGGYGRGGTITEPVIGLGASGRTFAFHKGEEVTPAATVEAQMDLLAEQNRLLRRLIDATQAAPAGLASALNSTSRQAAHRAAYSVR